MRYCSSVPIKLGIFDIYRSILSQIVSDYQPLFLCQISNGFLKELLELSFQNKKTHLKIEVDNPRQFDFVQEDTAVRGRQASEFSVSAAVKIFLLEDKFCVGCSGKCGKMLVELSSFIFKKMLKLNIKQLKEGNIWSILKIFFH